MAEKQGTGLKFSTKFDDRRMQRDFKRLRDEDQFKAAASALNVVRNGVRTDLKRMVARKLPVRNSAPLKRTASRILLPKTGKATWKDPVATSLQLFKYVPKIWQFPEKMPPQGLGGGEFIQHMSNGYIGVFKQKGSGTTKSGKAKITHVLVDQSDISERQLVRALTKAGAVRWPKAFRTSAKRYIERSR